MIKKINSKVLMTLLIVCIFTLTTFASAHTDNGNIALDKKLVIKGVPVELINSMHIDMKKDIVKNCFKFVGYAKDKLTETNSEDTSITGDVIMYGTIPSTDMYQYIQIYQTTNSPDNRERYVIYENFEWLNMPYFRLSDPFGVSWSTNWRAVPGTSLYRYYYDDSYTEEINIVEDTALAYADSTGCGWNADLSIDALDVSYGWGRITIESNTIGSISGSDQLAGNYSHVLGIGGIGLNIGVVSIVYNGTASADTQGIYLTFNY